MMDEATLDRVADAIEAAKCPGREGPFGLYDYSSYGWPNPHHVRDFRDPRSDSYGSCVAALTDPEIADRLYKTLTRRHIAEAAIAAMNAAP